jgi:hypothetical protein
VWYQRTGGDYRVAFGGEVVEKLLSDFTAFHLITITMKKARAKRPREARIIPRVASASISRT